MKTIRSLAGTLITALLLHSVAFAVPLQEAAITRMINDVRVIDPRSGSAPARVSQVIRDDMGVRTGIRSRAELLFQDNTLTRLNTANTALNTTPPPVTQAAPVVPPPVNTAISLDGAAATYFSAAGNGGTKNLTGSQITFSGSAINGASLNGGNGSTTGRFQGTFLPGANTLPYALHPVF